MKSFLEWSKHEHAVKLATHRRYEIASKPLLSFFKDARLDRITLEEIERFKTWRIRQRKQPPVKKVAKLAKEGKKATGKGVGDDQASDRQPRTCLP